jgi:hypothetical protein
MHLPLLHVAHDAWDVKPAPPRENVPAAHGFAVSDAVPAGQKWPGGHGACVEFVDAAVKHTNPAEHSEDELEELPVARHAPSGHARQVVFAVNDVPPPEYVPGGHATEGDIAPVPAGQK